MRPAVFLDRDDTLVRCNSLPPPPPPGKAGDLVDPALVELLPGAREACERLARSGFVLVVVSNQGSVARGAASLERVHQVNARVQELLSVGAASATGSTNTVRPVPRRTATTLSRPQIVSRPPGLIEAFYFCPYHPHGSVPEFTREDDWRKPAPGMIRAAVRELSLDLSRSWLIGDAPRDIESALAAGIPRERAFLIGDTAPCRNILVAAHAITA